jgi:predicted enzyme related to lactoylglutathione lyase
MLNFNNILVFSDNPQRLADFYGKILGKKPDWTGGDFVGFKAGDGYITFGPHDKVNGKNKNPERIIFNFEAENIDAEYKKIKGLGAKVIAEPYSPSEEENMKIATFEDPDGNYFQLTTPMKMN